MAAGKTTTAATSTGLSGKQSILVGITLFSMFFGAGNLILPPLLGYQAGAASVPAMVGFLIAGIGLPVCGVVSCALVGDLDALGGRVHPVFATVFAVLIYLSIGPCLAIPRTSSTSFEMMVPLLAAATGTTASAIDPVLLTAVRALFSVVFFAVAGLLALHPNKLTQLLGKITGPLLIILIVLVVGAAIVAPAGAPAAAQTPYDQVPALQGFITGYQTMDLLASLTFGIVIAQNIRQLGVREPGSVAREVVKAGIFMGVLMALVYCGTAYVGTALGHPGEAIANGATVLTLSATAHFGFAGTLVIAAIFLLACLNVCIGLLSCCGSFFESLAPCVPYRAWVIGFALFSCVVSNVGLDAILLFSVPLLSALYPVAIVLALMGVLRAVVDRAPVVWRWVVAATAVVSVGTSARDAFAPQLVLPVDALPGAAVGFAWVFPAVVACLVGVVHSWLCGRGRSEA